MEATAQQQTPSPEFVFVAAMADELNKGILELPSFPDVAMRIQRTLSDEDCSIDKVVRVVSTEPSLAARLLALANSAAYNNAGSEVRELRTAINRLGLECVRTAAMALGLKDMMKSVSEPALQPRLQLLWQHSVGVAAASCALARQGGCFNTDEALVAGLLHDIGKLYILTRAQRFPELFRDETTLDAVLSDWHPQVGESILQNWQMPEELCAVAARHEDLEFGSQRGQPELADVVCVANQLIMLQTLEAISEADWDACYSFTRLRIEPDVLHDIVADSNNELRALSQALS